MFGKLHMNNGYRLAADELVTWVQCTLKEMGLSARIGRPKLEDLVVDVPEFAADSCPWVVEVKSGAKVNPNIRNLRQLDDWVFDLSGERRIRRSSLELGKGKPNVSHRYIGAIQPAAVHPTTHKGVLIYNGPVGMPLNQRPRPMLGKNQGENELKFADVRSFCVISLPCLDSWATACAISPTALKEFWSSVQICMGELEHYRELQDADAAWQHVESSS
jgi:hypothetical protein